MIRVIINTEAINKDITGELTEKRIYKVYDKTKSKYKIVNDKGQMKFYEKEWLTEIEQPRTVIGKLQEKLEQIEISKNLSRETFTEYEIEQHLETYVRMKTFDNMIYMLREMIIEEAENSKIEK